MHTDIYTYAYMYSATHRYAHSLSAKVHEQKL